jgi:integrase
MPVLATVLEMFLAERKHFKHATLKTYKETARYFLPEFGSRRVADITAHEIAIFRSELACRYSPRTVNRIIGLLRTVTRFAHERGFIEHNKLAAIRSLREEIPDIDPLTLPEFHCVIQRLRPLHKQFFELMFWTGCRPCELMALRWKDIDFTACELRITRARVRGVEDTPKTRSSKRVIPLLAPALLALERQKIYSYSDIHNYVFVTRAGGPVSKHMDGMWKRACKRAGVRHRPLYQLRHTFASMALAVGETPAYVARLLGHTTTETLYRHYARWIPNKSTDGKRLAELAL